MDKYFVAAAKTELWQNFIFWENAFFDMVSQERDIIGMDQDPSDMIDRYAGLNETEKKRLELEEDRILATLLHNLTAYMVMCQAPTRLIQQVCACVYTYICICVWEEEEKRKSFRWACHRFSNFVSESTPTTRQGTHRADLFEEDQPAAGRPPDDGRRLHRF